MSNGTRFDREGRRAAILVLGMHRSGTSAAAGVISRLGAALPNTPVEADQRNAKGYGESATLVDLHDRLLASGGSSWRDWEPFDPYWIRSPFAESFAKELRTHIATEFGEAPLFVVKDPRLCRILPFWLEQLELLEIAPKAVLVVRNPLEVAASLESRDHFSSRISQLLWLRYVLDAEAATRDLPRCWVHYDDLLQDWRGVAGRLSATLDIDWPSRKKDVDIDKFLSRELHHHASSPQQLALRSDVLDWVKIVYKLVSDRQMLSQNSSGALEALDQVRRDFDTACAAFRPLIAAELRRSIADLERVSRDFEIRTIELKKLTAKFNSREKQIDYLIWRLMRPIQTLKWKLRPQPNSDAEGPAKTPGLASADKAVDPSDKRNDAIEQAPIQPVHSPNSLASYLSRGAADRRTRDSSGAVRSDTQTAKMPVASADGTDPDSIPDRIVFDVQPRSQIAVVCHVYYLSFWDELSEQIAQIPGSTDLYVTITDQPGAAELAHRISTQHAGAQVRIVENHGRDIFPFIAILNSGILDSYYLICKLHTKKSPHRKDGDYWRRKLLFGLLGSPENVADILRGFNANPALGLVVADGELYRGEKGWKANRDRSQELAESIGIHLDDHPALFVHGSFFWLRGSALKPLRSLGLTAASFEPENGNLDGTTAHAIERLFSIFAMAEGFSVVERSRIELPAGGNPTYGESSAGADQER